MNKRSNRLLSMLLALLMVVAVMPVITLSAADDGVLEVYTPEDFLLWGTNSADYTKVELKADIDMAGKAWTPIDAWGGTFEGNGYTVSNLTADYSEFTGAGAYGDGQKADMQGGLIRLAKDGLTIQNVAFVNMNCIFKKLNTGSHTAGMIFGIGDSHGASIKIQNVVIVGKNNGNSLNTGLTLGMVGGICNYDATVTIENLAFVCTDANSSRFDTGFCGSNKDKWGSFGKLNVKNSYVAGIRDDDVVKLSTSKTIDGTPRQTLENVYSTGAQDRTYGAYSWVSSTDNTPLYYKDIGAASFYAAVGEGNTITQEHMYGNSMELPVAAWNTYDNGLPVPSTIKNASTLSTTMTDPSLMAAFLVSEPADLLEWAANAASISKVVLVNDIDMADVAWTPVDVWGGTFDGNGYAIYNLTADYSNFAGSGVWGWGQKGDAQGGLVRLADNGFTVQNVAFINMNCIFRKLQGSNMAGMIHGMANSGGAQITIQNVLISGKNNGQSQGTTLQIGMFGGGSNTNNDRTTIENCAFIGTDPGSSRFDAGFCGASHRDGYVMGTVTIKNSYAAGIATTDVVNLTAVSCQHTTPDSTSQNFTNVYCTGAQDRVYGTYGWTSASAPGTSMYYKDIGAAAFYDAVGAGNVIENRHFYGNNMGFAAADWNTFDTSLPVPAALKNATAISELATYGNMSVISNADQLDAWAQAYNAGTKKDAILTADIIYNEDVTNPTRTFVGVKDFANIFDGQNFTIYGLYQEATITDSVLNVAFIQNLAAGAEIKNVAFRDGVQKLNMAAGADAAAIFAGADGNRTNPATLATVVGNVNGYTVTLRNVYSDNDLIVNFAKSATETANTAVGVGGLLGNLKFKSEVIADKVQYVGQITVNIAQNSGTADVGGFFGGAWGTKRITLSNAFFVTDFIGDAVIQTSGIGGRVEMPAIRTNHDSGFGYYDARDGMTHETNAYNRIANNISDGIHFYSNVYVTNRVQNCGGEQDGDNANQKLNWAYAIAVDGVTEDTQFGGVYPFTRYTFKVDDAQEYINSADVYYYALTKQVNAFAPIDQAACAGLTGFTFANNAFPVLTDFADNAKDAQQLSEVLYNDAHYLQSIGASIRLSKLADKQGLRFTYAVNQNAFNLAENGYTMEFGMLLIPTTLLNGAALTLANTDAMVYSNVTGADVLLDVLNKNSANAYYSYWNNTWKSVEDSQYLASFNGARVNFDDLGDVTVHNVSFTARAYVIIKDSNGAEVATIYNDAITCSILDVANAVVASDTTSADVKEKINGMFSGVSGFTPAN